MNFYQWFGLVGLAVIMAMAAYGFLAMRASDIEHNYPKKSAHKKPSK
jgi:hypothetical protein